MTRILSSILFFFLLLFLPSQTYAQTAQPKQEYMKAKVVSIEKEGTRDIGGTKNLFQQIKLQIISGTEKDKQISLEYGGTRTLYPSQKVRAGDTVILTKVNQGNSPQYIITDKYRTPWILSLLGLFCIIVIAISGRKGIGALVGMGISLGVIMFFIIPQILSGNDPLFISLIGSLFILFTTIYLAHGFSERTTIAVGSTFLSLSITAVLAITFVKLLHLSGLGSEDAYSLAQGFSTINFQGLLLGGIIIGSLGALDDVTTTQCTTIYELAKSNPKATMESLIKQGLIIGKEHIASLVNTLVLAYAGASIGVFIFLHLSIQQGTQPLWVTVNSEVLVEEIVRSLAGSIGLILAVPLTTIIASFFAKHRIELH